MLEPLPEIKREDFTLDNVIQNREKLNEIIAYLSVVASSFAPTPHLEDKNG